LSPDGSRLYSANGLSNSLSVIDTKTDSVVATIPVGRRPWGVTIVQ
jgi:YVTN family beta-propeller protein